jgi:predicted nucleotidyltransferase
LDSLSNIFETRATYSVTRLDELANRLEKAAAVQRLSNFTIFSAGSYARHEASKYSDIDLFFLWEGKREDHEDPMTSELRLFGALIEMVDAMDFPRFSNDAQYLSARSSRDILDHLGSPKDDWDNLFTVRMLMLLESKCLYGTASYEHILRDIIGSYYRDYPDHQATFEPWFLLNDIGRFWKTLLLNYEHKRNYGGDDIDKTKQKVRNFKLKFSRMTTCFATIAVLGSHGPASLQEDDVFALIQLTPRERLERIAELQPHVRPLLDAVLEEYAWFLEQTALPEPDLRGLFEDKKQVATMFERANAYGDKMFELLAAIDAGEGGAPTRFLRYLVI